MTDVENHPAANLFPMMPADELEKLAEDIKTNGLAEPIATLEGKILDGRNRLKACQLAGVDARYVEVALNGHSPTLYVVTKNLYRRHLSISQRAAIAAEMLPMLREEARKRMSQGGKKHAAQEGVATLPPLSGSHKDNDLHGKSRAIAAKAVGVGGKTVQDAATLMSKDPKLFESIKRGEVAVNTALKAMTTGKPPDKRKYVIPTPGTKRRAAMERCETERVINGISRIRGECHGLGLLKTQLIIIPDKERKTWADACVECAGKLRAFANKIRKPS